MDRREMLASAAATVAVISAGGAQAAIEGASLRVIAVFQDGLGSDLMAAQEKITRDASGPTEFVRIASFGILDMMALDERLALGGHIRLIGIVAPANRALLIDTVRWHSGRILSMIPPSSSDAIAQHVLTAEIS